MGPGPVPVGIRGAAAVLTAALVLVVQAGGLVSGPLYRAGLIWPTWGAALTLALLLSGPTRWWRTGPVALFVVFWAAWWAWMPYAVQVAPDATWAGREVESLGWCALLSLAAVFAGTSGGPVGWRVGWLLGLALTGSIGV